jgi:hypothetical protein
MIVEIEVQTKKLKASLLQILWCDTMLFLRLFHPIDKVGYETYCIPVVPYSAVR